MIIYTFFSNKHPHLAHPRKSLNCFCYFFIALTVFLTALCNCTSFKYYGFYGFIFDLLPILLIGNIILFPFKYSL